MTVSAAPTDPKTPTKPDTAVLENLVRNGVLHVINEEVLWPLGLSLTVAVRRNLETDELYFEGGTVFFEDHGEVVRTAFDLDDHAEEHKKFDALAADRLATIKP